MKTLCLLLSVYVIMLATKPCCADNDCQTQKVGKKELTHKAATKEKECDGCSPFYICGTCTGFVTVNTVAFNLKFIAEVPVPAFTFYKQPGIPQISLSIWQQPQLS